MGYYKTYFNIVDKQVGAFVLYAAFFDFLKVKFGGDKSKTRRIYSGAEKPTRPLAHGKLHCPGYSAQKCLNVC